MSQLKAKLSFMALVKRSKVRNHELSNFSDKEQYKEIIVAVLGGDGSLGCFIDGLI
jgi:hypothetical protein